jgi:hypothetical protein
MAEITTTKKAIRLTEMPDPSELGCEDAAGVLRGGSILGTGAVMANTLLPKTLYCSTNLVNIRDTPLYVKKLREVLFLFLVGITPLNGRQHAGENRAEQGVEIESGGCQFHCEVPEGSGYSPSGGE